MRTYATYSKNLCVTVDINGVKKNILFNRGIRQEGLMAVMIKDPEEAKALESVSAFNSEFWFLEEHADQQPVKRETHVKKIYYKPGQEPKQNEEVKDYPEVINAQSAKLILLPLGHVHAELANNTMIREVAKTHNITFSNWK